MKFCDFAKLMHDNYEEKANAGKFVVILFDAILDGEALEKAEPNPLYGLGKSTLEAYYSGRRLISQRKAAQIVSRLFEETFAEFVETYSMDALNHISDKLFEFGFDVESYDVGRPVQISLRRLYEVFAEKLKRERFTNADIPLLSKGMQANYCEQRAAYYSALSIEHSVRDVFDDGENEFQKLKEDAWHGINTIYW